MLSNEVGVMDKQSALVEILNAKDITHLSVREKIDLIESAMHKYEQVEIPVKHSFADGMYIREILIPKGTLLTSKYHKYEQIDVMLTGDMSIVTNEGVVRVKAPFVGISTSGMKRLGYAHEDTLWIDIHSTKEKDITKLEKMLYVDTFEELEQFELERCRKDFLQLLVDYNISSDLVYEQSINADDQISISLEKYNISVADSKIEGKGIFATGSFSKGYVIAPARINMLRTQVERFTNHSVFPNAEMILDNNDIYLVAKRNICKEEITVNYRNNLALSNIYPVIKETILCQV